MLYAAATRVVRCNAWDVSGPILIEREDLYRALVESSDDAIVSQDTDGVVLSWNPAAERIFGYSGEEMVGRSIRVLLPPDRHEEEDLILQRIRSGEHVGQFITKRLHKSGRLLDIAVTVSPVFDKSGGIVGASKIARDVGPYLEDQRRIRESERRFQLLANSISQFVWMADPQANNFWYNQRWYDYTGTTLEQMRGWGWLKVHHPDHVDRVRKGMQHSWATGEEWEDTFPLRGKDGRYRWFLSRAMPVRDEDGNVVLWFGTNTDITEQREQAEQIRLLLLEVNHRSKNMLSNIQALARRSIGADSPVLERFQERVRSLAVNQDILVRREWREVPLEELVRLQLDFVDKAPGAIVAHGPPLLLNPRAAEVIGMALHEMASNSLRNGALSAHRGKVSIGWTRDEKRDLFTMEWCESGGPKVAQPKRSGFGSTLIRDVPQRYFGGEIELKYPETGMFWKMSGPLELLEPGYPHSAKRCF